MDARNNIADDLFYKIRSRFSGLKLGSETGEITINPSEARFFDFDYMEGQNPIGHVSISLAEPNSMKVYFSHGITEGMDDHQKDNWYGFLKELRQFAKRRLLNFDTRDIAKDNLDQRDYEFLVQNAQPKQQPNTIQQPVGESIMSESAMYGTKTVSYQKLMDTRLIIKHSQALTDDMAPGARSRHISALFVENQEGERFKYPFIHLAGARAMQRHVANGGLPYDDIGKSIIGMSEEIAQLKSFGNYVVRNDLMNSETNNIVERSSTQLDHLREQIKALSKQHHYEAYKENFQSQSPIDIPSDVVEDFKEKFTVRSFKEDIATVFPVLYRLMQEENKIGYDDIVAMTQEEIQMEDSERDQDERDPFDQFESWVMELGEESGITSNDPDQMNASLSELQELVSNEFPAGVDGTNAIESLRGIIEDPQLYREIKEQAKQDPNADVRELIYSWMGENAPQAAQRLDFGDFEPMPQDPMAYANAAADADAIAYGQREAYGDAGWDDPRWEPREPDMSRKVDWDIEAERNRPDEPAGEPKTVSIVNLETGEVVDTFPSTGEFYGDEKQAMKMGYDLNDPDSPYQLKWSKKQTEGLTQGKQKMNTQELAEFIHSFYDRESNTFPKGPEGVCTMVGKKFGEQAEMVARKMVERMAPQQSTQQNPELAELARVRELAGIQGQETDVNELDYKSFTSGDELAELRDAIDKNVLVSVAFVKKDGTVKHMGIKKNISSYVPSSREKTDRQLNVEQNNDIKKVVDINAYIRALKELKAAGMEEDQAKAEASKKAWRSVNLKNVLGFMVKGKFIDLRDENEIQQRFGDEIYNSVTPAMKSALAQSQQATESFDMVDSEVDEARGADNFTADDIHELEQIDDIDQVKRRALELIMTPSKRPMKPEKVGYFREKIGMMKSKMDIIKLMYDLLLSGEGFGVVGSRNSMGANTYRQRFKDSIENEAADELARIKDLSGL